jgi:DNA-binding NtrC family response regulator
MWASHTANMILSDLTALAEPPEPDDEAGGDLIDGARVLVAASDACWRWSLCGWLALRGATTRQVGGGADALELLADGARFDLLVVDLRAGALDSVWIVATLRALGLALPCVIVDGRMPRLAARVQRLGERVAVMEAPLPFEQLPLHAERLLAPSRDDATRARQRHG